MTTFPTTTTIPKIIHRVWLQKGVNPDPSVYQKEIKAYSAGPEKYINDEKYIPSFVKHNPDFTHKLWNTREIYDLFWTNPQLQKYQRFFFYRLSKIIHKCDFARLALLLIYGGVYYDLDFICYRSLNNLIANRSFFWSLDIGCHDQGYIKQALSVVMDNRSSILTAAMGCTPGHWIIAELMDFFMQTYRSDFGAMQTGPAMAGRFAREYKLTIDDRPDLYVDTRLIVSSTWWKTKLHFWKHDPNLKPFTSTLMTDGTDWGGEKLEMMIFPIIKGVVFSVLVLILFFMLIRYLYGRV